MTGRLLEGRTAVLFGAARTRGMGLATARLFHEHGARIVLLDFDAAEVDAAVAQFPPGSALGRQVDVRDPESCRAAIADALGWDAAQGRIDAVINFAGVTQKRAFADIGQEDFDLLCAINLKGAFNVSQAVLGILREQRGGSLVHISSLGAQQGGLYGGAHYCATKAGILGMVRTLAVEYGKDNVRVNAIAPGLIITDFSRSGRTDEEKQASATGWPLQRAGSVQEMAGACLYLACDLSTYVTGATLDVNGGAYLR
ncbi:SDR family NAD(P)-dependent oxidoreductase [Bordetella genomosp. 13]|uniref:SDR family NAD(P)-dependent oxidoreductase n=1 Tax=Bordetella genomosp. 13 TaxID=463040 RepID=UPI00119E1CB2|nr:SDR family NAD(P)-dependent oxidoreductase [Bordetella genomosp. 13]